MNEKIHYAIEYEGAYGRMKVVGICKDKEKLIEIMKERDITELMNMGVMENMQYL